MKKRMVLIFGLGSVGLAAMLALQGCYKHVVGAKGMSRSRYDIHEPNLRTENPQPDVVVIQPGGDEDDKKDKKKKD